MHNLPCIYLKVPTEDWQARSGALAKLLSREGTHGLLQELLILLLLLWICICISEMICVEVKQAIAMFGTSAYSRSTTPRVCYCRDAHFASTPHLCGTRLSKQPWLSERVKCWNVWRVLGYPWWECLPMARPPSLWADPPTLLSRVSSVELGRQGNSCYHVYGRVAMETRWPGIPKAEGHHPEEICHHGHAKYWKLVWV